MPDNYLRDTQRLSLRLQEKCMAHLREGGDVMEFQICLVAKTPNASASKPGLDGAKVKAKRPFVKTLGFKHQIGVPTPRSTSSESDPEVPDNPVLDPEAEDAKFITAKLFILNASTGFYHLRDFSESLLNPDKWTPLCRAKSSKDLVTLESVAPSVSLVPIWIYRWQSLARIFAATLVQTGSARTGASWKFGYVFSRTVPAPTTVGPRTLNLPRKRLGRLLINLPVCASSPVDPRVPPWTLDASDAPPACLTKLMRTTFYW